MSFHHSPQICTKGLVLLLDAANPKSYPGSGTIVNDLSGNSNDLTLSTSTIATSNPGTLAYDGTAKTSDLSSTLIGDGDNFTISMWCYLLSDSARGGIFQRKQISPYNGIALGKGGGGSMYASLVDTSSNSITISLSQYINTWTEYTINYDSTTKTINGYINSAFTDTNTNSAFTNVITTNSDNVVIGYRPGTSITYFNGYIAFIRIYTKALTQSEITQNYNALRSRFGL